MTVDIFIEDRGRRGYQLLGESQVNALKHDLKDALDDIADSIFQYASHFAPESDPEDKAGGSAWEIPSGTLKANPVDIFHSGYGEAAAVGASGFRFRAPAGATSATGEKIGGQFISGTTEGHLGHVFYVIDIEYPQDPFYAKFVAFGTSGHGPKTAKVMRFAYQGHDYRTTYVNGQDPQPYLDRAVLAVQTEIDIKVSELRAEARFI